MLYAFDLLELDGEDLRALPLSDRKKRLARLVGKRRLGIVLNDHADEDGTMQFVGGDNGDSFFFQSDVSPIADVPEPGTLGLAGVALVGLAGYVWRRRHS